MHTNYDYSFTGDRNSIGFAIVYKRQTNPHVKPFNIFTFFTERYFPWPYTDKNISHPLKSSHLPLYDISQVTASRQPKVTSIRKDHTRRYTNPYSSRYFR